MREARLSRMASVADFHRAAQGRLPKMFFDYIEGGASGEVTLAENTADFDRMRFRPRVLRDVSGRDLSASFLGGVHALPLMLGPVGSLGLFRAGAEAASFSAASEAGVPACLSSFAITRPETLAPILDRSSGFQLYVLKDRDKTLEILDRVAAAGFGSLFLTVDTAVAGIRERDMRNGLRQLTTPDLGMMADFARHPRWLVDMLRIHPVCMGLADKWPQAGRGYLAQAAFLASQIDPALDWPMLRWLRAHWKGRLIVKGIQTPEDALQCAEHGVDGIVVSNHGGRQLDGTGSALAALGPIARAVGDTMDVLFDSGIRRGGDIAKALALGASACLLGRAYVYGVTAAGEKGVTAVLSRLRAELDVTLALIGLCSIVELREAGETIFR